MKHSYIYILMLTLIGATAYGIRRGTVTTRRPQTTAEQLMRKYTPAPYPTGRARPYRRFDRTVPYGGAYYGDAYYGDDYTSSAPTNEPEDIGIK